MGLGFGMKGLWVNGEPIGRSAVPGGAIAEKDLKRLTVTLEGFPEQFSRGLVTVIQIGDHVSVTIG